MTFAPPQISRCGIPILKGLGNRFAKNWPTCLLLIASLCASSSLPRALAIPAPCTDHWTNASSDNEFDCSNVQDWIGKPQVWSTFIPLVIGVIVFLPLCWVVLCARYCCNCCGSSLMRPSTCCGCGEEAARDDQLTDAERRSKYGGGCILTVKVLSGMLALAGIAGVVLSYVGGAKLNTTAGSVDGVLVSVGDWAVNLIHQVRDGVVNPEDPTDYPDGFDPQTFTDVALDIRGYQKDAQDAVADAMDYIRLAGTIIGYASMAPGLTLLAPLVAAIFSIRVGLPLCFILFGSLFQFLYMVFATLFLILALIGTIVYEDLGYPLNPAPSYTKPSLTEWYLIPTCDKEAPFISMKNDIATMERDAAQTACEELLKVCSEDATWSTTLSPSFTFGPGWSTADYSGMSDDYKRVFHCDLAPGSAAQRCQRFQDVKAIVDAMHVKAGVPPEYACGTEIDNSNCTVSTCAKNCTQADIRDGAATAVKEMATASRVLGVYERVLEPYMDCRALIRQVIVLGTRTVTADFKASTQLLAAGALCLGVGCILAMVFGCLGQKRYIRKPTAEELAAEVSASGDTAKVVGGYPEDDVTKCVVDDEYASSQKAEPYGSYEMSSSPH